MIAGYELTFTNRSLIEAGRARGELELDTVENLAALERFVGAIREGIGDHEHAIEDDGHGFGRHVITELDGNWFKVEIDPWVVEITGKPSNLAFYRAIAPRMERLFAIASSCDLEPHARIGGGHVHISRTSFESPMAIRNFIVDYANHPELALGIQGHDLLNAPPLAIAPRSSIEAFVEGLARFDRDQDLEALFAHLRADVYTFAGSPELPVHARRAKYQALCVEHPATIEIRAIRPPRSFAEFIATAELFARRIAFLAGRGPIAYRAESWSGAIPPEAFLRDRYETYLAELDTQASVLCAP